MLIKSLHYLKKPKQLVLRNAYNRCVSFSLISPQISKNKFLILSHLTSCILLPIGLAGILRLQLSNFWQHFNPEDDWRKSIKLMFSIFFGCIVLWLSLFLANHGGKMALCQTMNLTGSSMLCRWHGRYSAGQATWAITFHVNLEQTLDRHENYHFSLKIDFPFAESTPRFTSFNVWLLTIPHSLSSSSLLFDRSGHWICMDTLPVRCSCHCNPRPFPLDICSQRHRLRVPMDADKRFVT